MRAITAKAAFYFVAIMGHIVFVSILIAIPLSTEHLPEAYATPVNWSLKALAYLMGIVFSLNIDYFLVSSRLHGILAARRDDSADVSYLMYNMRRVVTWLFAVATPITGLIVLHDAALALRVYVLAFYALALLLLSGYLFRTYPQYLELRRANKWGILGVW